MNQPPLAFWSLPAAELLAQLQTTPQGVSSDEARQRLARYGSNLLLPGKRSDSLALFLTQFKSPITLILLFAAGLSFFVHEHVQVLIILVIVLISGLLGFWQEKGAANAIEKLLAIVQIKAMVLRDGSPGEIPVEEIVPGDVIILNGGDIIPGDCLLIVASAFLFPFMPLGKVFGFSQLPISFLLLMAVIVTIYIIAAEMVKAVFYRRVKF